MSRKGVTPVLATSLLILIAISAVSTAAVFLRDTTDDITGGVEDQLSEQERIDGTSISIERGYNNSDSDISLMVRNTGRYLVAVEDSEMDPGDNRTWTLYVDGRPQEFDYESGNPDIRLDSGETITIDTNTDYPSPGDYKRLEVQGRYETETGIICSNSGGQNC